MRKKILLVLLAVLAFPIVASALSLPGIRVTIDGIPVTFPDQGPVILDGRTLVPVRGVFEELGFYVGWNENMVTLRRIVSIGGDSPDSPDMPVRFTEEVFITIGSEVFSYDNTLIYAPQYHILDVPAQIINGRTMLPIRAVLESVGYSVDWDSDTNTVLISSAPIVAPPELPGDINTAIINFSQELFRQSLLSAGLDCENMVISPLSAYYALSMVALGAGGETLDEFTRLLGGDPQALASELSALAAKLMDVSGSTDLTVAGSVWICDEFTVHPEFNRRMTNYFGAPAFPRNFADDATVDDINAWIYEQTNGLIDNVLDEIDDEIMFLINTLYMYAKWADAFRPMHESVRTFTPETGGAQEVNFLTAGGQSGTTLDVRVTDAYEAVLLPYDDGRLGFFMVRPSNGTSVRDFAQTHNLADIFAGLETHGRSERDTWGGGGVVVHMPELDKNFRFSLISILQAMGLEAAFSPFAADLDNLVESLLGYPGLYISSVEQVVRMMVDSEGTEAAAVTIIGVSPASAPPPPSLILDFNTPYIYAILDLETGIPLFIGIVDNPLNF